jgi:hypothetical protein
VLRFLVVLVAFLVGALLIEPTWIAKEKTLKLRVRDGREVVQMGRRQTLRLGEWIVRETGGAERTDVGAGPRRRDAAAERIRPEERKRLDRLIDEKTRD